MAAMNRQRKVHVIVKVTMAEVPWQTKRFESACGLYGFDVMGSAEWHARTPEVWHLCDRCVGMVGRSIERMARARCKTTTTHALTICPREPGSSHYIYKGWKAA